jgi:hypothetical protein
VKIRSGSILFGTALSALAFLAGCHGSSILTPSNGQVRAQQRAELDSQREQLDQIPPPTKSRYMAIHSFESWQNPYLTVQPGMLELHVTLADSNTSSFGEGGMMRPIGARQQELNLSLDTLGEAMASIPQNSWPYGRVIALEEAKKTPLSAEPAVRRNMETVIGKLNDLGIVVYDVNDGKVQ